MSDVNAGDWVGIKFLSRKTAKFPWDLIHELFKEAVSNSLYVGTIYKLNYFDTVLRYCTVFWCDCKNRNLFTNLFNLLFKFRWYIIIKTTNLTTAMPKGRVIIIILGGHLKGIYFNNLCEFSSYLYFKVYF